MISFKTNCSTSHLFITSIFLGYYNSQEIWHVAPRQMLNCEIEEIPGKELIFDVDDTKKEFPTSTYFRIENF